MEGLPEGSYQSIQFGAQAFIGLSLLQPLPGRDVRGSMNAPKWSSPEAGTVTGKGTSSWGPERGPRSSRWSSTAAATSTSLSLAGH